MGGGGVNASNVGDICLYDKIQDKLIIVDGNEFSGDLHPLINYSPVGIVVVPRHHDVYKDGSCAIVSLRYMNCDKPEIGGVNDNELGIVYGQMDVDLEDLNNYDEIGYVGDSGVISKTIIGVDSEACLPSDQFSTVNNPYDKKTSYYYRNSNKYIPSPYNNDDSFNSEYSRTESPSSPRNAMSDFNGIGNTKILCEAATRQTNWKTAFSIDNYGIRGYSPAACCCWRYHTEGTKQGDWYLPACGELGYMIVRLQKINETIEKIKTEYDNKIEILEEISGVIWSSSEINTEHARYVFCGDGRFERYYPKNDSYREVRAFLRINSNGKVAVSNSDT